MNVELPSLAGPMQPPLSGKTAKQLVILLHGLGADGDDLMGLAPMLADNLPDAIFVSPNAPFQCDMSPYGYQWFSMQQRDPDFLLEGVREAAPILNNYIDQQLDILGLDDSSLALIGFSQGCMMSLHVSLRRSKACAAVVGFSGALVGENAIDTEITARPPICLLHGDADAVVPYMALSRAVDNLKRNRVGVEYHTRRGLGHGIDPEGLNIAGAFLKKHFNNEE